MFITDYGRQLFYCIKKNNLVCIRGIIRKLEELGLTILEILRLRNNLGDTPIIYAIRKGGEIDIVRFFLLQQGTDLKSVNNDFESLIKIAIGRGRIDMINAITEMMSYSLETKRINNKENVEMYNWALKAKGYNELQCRKDQEK